MFSTETLDAAARAMALVDYRDAGELKFVPTRNGFGEGLIEAGNRNQNVLGICADLAESTRMEGFKKAHPAQYIEIGVAEQMLVALAGGLAAVGKVPWIASYAMFNPGRSWEQVRTIMALNESNVKIAGSARRRFGRSRRRNAPSDRGYRDHARDPPHDRGGAV